MPATLKHDADSVSTERSLGRRLRGLLLTGFPRPSHPLLGPMCIWLPYPPYLPRAKRPQAHPDTEAEVGRH
jgi:hypothetical protein